MKHLIFILVQLLLIIASCSAQDKKVGGPCGDCGAINESPIPFNQLKPVMTLPGASWDGKKPMGINGTVYMPDGKTLAAGIILYIYHVDDKGNYPKKGNEKGWAKKHGYLRGWLRTDEKGMYKFVCLRPAPNLGGKAPANIHIVVKEPGLSAYAIDDVVFSDDLLLTNEVKKGLPNRGGSGIVKIVDVGNMFKGERNIYLGKNILNYPKQ